eukprot:tig00000405_g489.t1
MRPFRFGWVEADVCVAAFDPRGFARDEIVTRLVPDTRPGWEPQPPPDLKAAYEEASAHWKQKVEQGVIRNDVLMLALKGCKLLTEADAEEREKLKFRFYSPPPRLLLEFILSTYVEHRSASTLFQSFDADRKLRELGISVEGRDGAAGGGGPVEVKDFWSNSFGVQLAVITADGKMVYGTRSARTAVNPGGVVLGVVEGMDQEDVLEETGLPCPYHAAARGLLEEQGIELGEDAEEAGRGELRLTALVLNAALAEWNMVGYFRSAAGPCGVTAAQLLARRQAAAKECVPPAAPAPRPPLSPPRRARPGIDLTPPVRPPARQRLGVPAGGGLGLHAGGCGGLPARARPRLVNYAKVGAVLALLAHFPEADVRAAFEAAPPPAP